MWKQFWTVVNDFGSEAITVNKVKAHATQLMVESGVVSAVDRWGNSQADDAAKRGAAMHPSIAQARKDMQTSRFVAASCVQWLGVGLESAHRVGALPKELSAAQKSERPCQRAGRRVEVVPDELWWQERRQDHLT